LASQNSYQGTSRMSTHASSHQYFISRPIYSYPDFNVENEHCTGVDRTFRDRLSESYRTALRLIKSIFPVTDWLFRYPVREWLLSDIISGVSTGLVSSLQGLAYALLVSVSPVYGLYSAFFPIIPYFIFGTSRHVSVGPFPVTCLMVGSVVMTLTPDDDFLVPLNISGVNETTVDVEAREAQRIVIACSMTVLIGLIQVIMGLLQVGFLVRYLSDPLVGGFTTAAALHVFISQLKTILSVPTSSHSGLFSIAYTLGDVLRNIKQTNTADLLAGLMTIAVVMTVKEFNAKFQHKIPVSIPIELIVTVVATGISYAVDLESRYGASTVRSIPRGFASPSLPDQGVFWKTLEPGFSTAVVGYAVAVSVAKVYAAKNDYAINGNQELIAFGISNVFSGCFSSFVASTALSRTAVQASTGGKTQVAGVISATVVMVVILALGQLLEPLQKSVLAGVVIANLRGMFLQVLDVLVLWRQNRADCLIWIATCLASVVLGLDVGLLTGLAFEICTVVFRTQFGIQIYCLSLSFCHVAHLGWKVISASPFQNGVVSAVSLCQENKGFEGEGDVVRVGPGERADLHLDWASKLPVPVNVPRVQIHSLVLDFSAVSFLDVVAVKALRLVGPFTKTHTLPYSNNEMVKNMESLSFFDEAVTKDLLFLSVHDAVLFIRRGEADGSLQNPALRSVRSMSDTFTVVEYIHSTVRPFVLMDYKCCLFVPRGWAKGLSPQWVRCRCSCPARSQWMTD
uniref:Solute carrier family 26 member 4 n=1 Tax=Scleropages formosus TaxID=113540 RepID=A0A8C9T8J5_SCLFO